MTKVRFAYCKEADEDLTIDRARAYYFAQPENTRKRLTFFCSDAQCRVPVTGVNYDKLPAEIARRAGYSENPVHKHKACCEWKMREATATAEKKVDESQEDYLSRLVDQKLGCLINAFNPNDGGEGEATPADTADDTVNDTMLKPEGQGSGANSTPPERKQRALTETSSLYQITDTWLEYEKTLSAAEFAVWRIRIKNVGHMLWTDYVLRITRLREGNNTGVFYGGIKMPVLRYGQGFSATFYDEIGGMKITLYLSAETMKKSALNPIAQPLLGNNNLRYLTVFILNPRVVLHHSKSGNVSYSIQARRLKDIALYAGPER